MALGQCSFVATMGLALERRALFFFKVGSRHFEPNCETQPVFNMTSFWAPGAPKREPGSQQETSPRTKNGLLVSAACLLRENGEQITSDNWRALSKKDPPKGAREPPNDKPTKHELLVSAACLFYRNGPKLGKNTFGNVHISLTPGPFDRQGTPSQC